MVLLDFESIVTYRLPIDQLFAAHQTSDFTVLTVRSFEPAPDLDDLVKKSMMTAPRFGCLALSVH
jgi:hypothetical protein